MDLAVKYGCPVIGINDSGGARIRKASSRSRYAEIFWRNVQSSGVVPRRSARHGPCAGGGVLAGHHGLLLMVEGSSYMFITGPDVVKTVTGEEVTFEELGGAATHAAKSGVAHFISRDEEACLEDARYLLSFLPQNNLERRRSSSRPIRAIARRRARRARARRPRKPYDIKRAISSSSTTATCSRCTSATRRTSCAASRGSAAMSSASSAIKPRRWPACLDIDSSVKAARFVRTCDAFNIPLVTFVDVPGFLPGTDQEWRGIIRHGAKLLYAYAEATVPKLAVITRKAYGGAYDVMSSKHIRGDFNFAWPTAEVAVMGPEGAVNIVFRNGLEGEGARTRGAASSSPTTASGSPIRTSPPSVATSTTSSSREDASRAQDRCARDGALEARAPPKRKHGNIPL